MWIFIDRITKHVFNQFSAGSIVVDDLGNVGLLRLSVVHNFGAAWGSFAGQVSVLVLFTSALCLAIAGISVVFAKRASIIEMLGLALLFAGGVGNLYDRICQGYVTDFITPLFINFPTFNVADIGVTCGIVLLLGYWVVTLFKESHASDRKE